MLIFWKRRLVFLANTKTGSTSIEMALESLADVAIQRPPVLKHTPAARFTELLAPFLGASAQGEHFETVALIRDPLDWLGSWYRYRLREHLPIGGTESFAAFVAGYLDEPQAEFANVGSQTAFLTDADGRIAVDHLFRYEDIGQLVEFLEDRLDCEITLPHLNVSPRAPVDLPTDLSARLQERLSADYALYAMIGQNAGRARRAKASAGAAQG